MPGFCVSNLKEKTELINEHPERCVKGSVEGDSYLIQYHTLNKYMDDKVFAQNDRYLCVLEGVILNKVELYQEYHASSADELLCKMYEAKGDTFCKEFRGTFSGGIYEKKADKWVFFTDQFGMKSLYYYLDRQGGLVCGTQLNYVTDTMKANGIARTADQHGLSCMLAYGHFIDECIGVAEVKRLLPGHYMVLQDQKLQIDRYHVFSAEREHLSEQEYIERLDKAFTQAVKRCLDKDREYGYRTIIDISGGLDSRMNAYTAYKLGCRDALMMTYAQSGSKEYKIAQKVANELKYDYVFKASDNAKCMFDVDENVRMNNGSAIYDGITGGKDLLGLLNSHEFGLEINGITGHIYQGSPALSDGEGKPDMATFQIRDSLVLPLDDLTDSHMIDQYTNQEIFCTYAVEMLFWACTFPIRQNFVEPMSPYADKEFVDAYLSIPWKLRFKDKIFCKWMAVKYPAAAKYQYTLTGITVAEQFTLWGKTKELFKFVNREVHRKFNAMKRYQMEPYEYWLKQYPEIGQFIQNYYEENISRVDGALRDKASLMMSKGDKLLDKTPVLTLLSYYKHYLD